MKAKILCAVLVSAMALTACETTGGYGGGPPRTQLSQCMRNALIGAGIGAVAGAVIGDEDNRGENAAIGAAVGGLATYGACRWLSAREQQRVENAYYQSLNSGQGVNQSWEGEQGGGPRSLTVARPMPAPDRGPECRRVTATVSDGATTQSLPQETFCRNAAGQWVPA
jgi:surface antigen